ncbi:hypothetical protein SKAU_G00161440 [Synaphobranchus kaupii]|uniref:Uncharacterized protein n=1 Tax=Synaphobranchus kaupii TaxID=118154 RepID=A0A9Q1FJ12_SYNKA|nr:hypothetical protein SKAU_G00161440 [Synaphobranchus kaupii]
MRTRTDTIMVDKNIYIVQGEISTVVGAIKRNSRWSTHTPLDEEQDPLLNSFSHLKEILNTIKELPEVEPNVFLRPFLEVVRSEDTTGPITGLALTSVNKFLSYGLIEPVLWLQLKMRGRHERVVQVEEAKALPPPPASHGTQPLGLVRAWRPPCVQQQPLRWCALHGAAVCEPLGVRQRDLHLQPHHRQWPGGLLKDHLQRGPDRPWTRAAPLQPRLPLSWPDWTRRSKGGRWSMLSRPPLSLFLRYLRTETL